MAAKRFDRTTLRQLTMSGCMALLAAPFLVGPAHTQPTVSVPNPPTQMSNPSSPNTVPQASFMPPQAQTVPAHTATPAAHVERSMIEAYSAGSYPWAFHGYAAPGPVVAAAVAVDRASARWSPGFYDYAPGQFARGRPRYGGYGRPAGYHGD